MPCGSQEYIGWVPLARAFLSLLVVKETKFRGFVNRGGGIYSAGACCAQILYMKQSLLDYGVVLDRIPLLCDNESAVKIANNPVQHSRTKHIDIRHHFLRDHVARNDILLCGVRSEDQLADIFTKPLDESTFCRLQSELNVLDASNVM